MSRRDLRQRAHVRAQAWARWLHRGPLRRHGASASWWVAGGTEHGQICPPSELHIPFMNPPIDEVYAAALLEELSKRIDDARRLGGAIDWLDIVWRNTVSIDHDTRIIALRAGFEVLLGAGDRMSAIRDALCSLLDSADAKKLTRTWPTPQATRNRPAERPRVVVPTLLVPEDKLMHEEQPGEDDSLHHGERHLWLGEAHLRRAIKRTVAGGGHPAVLQSPLEGTLSKVADEVGLDSAGPTEKGKYLSKAACGRTSVRPSRFQSVPSAAEGTGELAWSPRRGIVQSSQPFSAMTSLKLGIRNRPPAHGRTGWYSTGRHDQSPAWRAVRSIGGRPPVKQRDPRADHRPHAHRLRWLQCFLWLRHWGIALKL